MTSLIPLLSSVLRVTIWDSFYKIVQRNWLVIIKNCFYKILNFLFFTQIFRNLIKSGWEWRTSSSRKTFLLANKLLNLNLGRITDRRPLKLRLPYLWIKTQKITLARMTLLRRMTVRSLVASLRVKVIFRIATRVQNRNLGSKTQKTSFQ